MTERAMLQYYDIIIIIIQAVEFGLDKGLDWVWKATEH
jgi:hypothetical protein